MTINAFTGSIDPVMPKPSNTENERAELKRKLDAGEISELDYWIAVTSDEGESFASQSYRSELAKWLKAKHQKEIQETWIPLVNDLRLQLEAARRAPVVLDKQPAIMPKGESAAAQLRAMATNYPAGHSWDKLDAKACIRGALEIEALRAMLAAAPQPPEACNPSMQPSPELATEPPEGQSNCASLEQLNENNRLQRSGNPTFKSAAAPVELPEPGQRPPLTLEQIQKALGVEVTEGSMPYAIARAIERAIP